MAEQNRNQDRRPEQNRDPKKAPIVKDGERRRDDKSSPGSMADSETKDQQSQFAGRRKHDMDTGNKAPTRPGERPMSNYGKSEESKEETKKESDEEE